MEIAELEERPPYVRFEQRAVEDRNKTQETGIFSYKDVEYVLVTPHGSKDVHEARADKWLEKQKKYADQGRIPVAHYNYFKQAYDYWKQGLEDPETGTPVKGWAAISPAQQNQVLQANIRTVEDLAQANEEALGYIGMGARPLKQKAQAWLMSADTGKAANQIQELQKKLDESEEERARQSEMIEEMAARLERLENAPTNKDGSTRKKPGPKPKSKAA